MKTLKYIVGYLLCCCGGIMAFWDSDNIKFLVLKQLGASLVFALGYFLVIYKKETKNNKTTK